MRHASLGLRLFTSVLVLTLRSNARTHSGLINAAATQMPSLQEEQCCRSEASKEFDFVIVTDDVHMDYQLHIDEDNIVKAALEKHGRNVTRKSFADPEFDWSQTKAVVFMSAFECVEDWPKWNSFIEKINEVAILYNPIEFMKWNEDKALYLEDLAVEQGINMPIKELVDHEEPRTTTLKDIQSRHGWGEMVLKPSISNQGSDVYKVTPSNIDEMELELQKLLGAGDDIYVEQYQHQLPKTGEIGVIVIDGEITHAVLKMPKEDDFRVHEEWGGSTILHDLSAEEVAFAEKVLHAIDEEVDAIPSFVRIDMFRDNSNQLAVMEVELQSAYLWFNLFPEAADKFAEHLNRSLAAHWRSEKECVADDVHSICSA